MIDISFNFFFIFTISFYKHFNVGGMEYNIHIFIENIFYKR